MLGQTYKVKPVIIYWKKYFIPVMQKEYNKLDSV